MSVHASMIPQMADDVQALQDARSLAGQLDSAFGWGKSVKFNSVEIGTPSGDITVGRGVTDSMTEAEKGQFLELLYKAQMRNVRKQKEKINENYGIVIDDPYDTGEEKDE